jgi:hypothetical protein
VAGTAQVGEATELVEAAAIPAANRAAKAAKAL